MIATHGLTKHYGKVQALREVSVEVHKGEVFGLLGPNGAGKTTTIRLLLGMLKPTAGRAEIAGFSCWRDSLEVRRYVSFVPGELRLYGHMTGLGLLKFLSGLRDGTGLERAVALAEGMMRLDLRRKLRTYSTGMKQKLALAQAFSDPVDVLILDEPTSPLDPSGRDDVLNLVREARNGGQTVIFSGHVLSEVEAVADRVGIMRAGQLVHIEDMHARRSLRMLLIRFLGPTPEIFPAELQVVVRERRGESILLEHHGELRALLAWLASQEVADIAIGTEDLKSLYDQYHASNAKDEKPAGGDLKS